MDYSILFPCFKIFETEEEVIIETPFTDLQGNPIEIHIYDTNTTDGGKLVVYMDDYPNLSQYNIEKYSSSPGVEITEDMLSTRFFSKDDLRDGVYELIRLVLMIQGAQIRG
jgi:hypothetical protein